MDSYILTNIALSIVLVVIGIFQKKRILLIILVTTSVVVGWHIQIIRVEFYNELAWQEFTEGTRMFEPADGASSSFALMFGWMPSLVLSIFIIGAQKLKKRYASKNT